MQRRQLVAIVRVLAGIGILLLMLAFLRACFSPPQIPARPAVDNGGYATMNER